MELVVVYKGKGVSENGLNWGSAVNCDRLQVVVEGGGDRFSSRFFATAGIHSVSAWIVAGKIGGEALVTSLFSL